MPTAISKRIRSTHLDRTIRHYKAIVKSGTPLQSHVAIGALDILEQVKELRDALREENKDLWRGRGNPNVCQTYHVQKGFVEHLNCIGLDI